MGWLISNKEDQSVLTLFLTKVKERTGPIIAKYFISDDAEQYYSSWNSVYGCSPKKLLCYWHVDKSWRVNIRSKISDVQKQLQVYHQLRTILEIMTIGEFRKCLQHFVSSMLADQDLLNFAEYFQTWYCKRIEQWAYCFRIGTPANTNMAVEAFHRYLKVVYLDGKHNRRVDHLLSVLLRVSRDKIYDRLIKLEKGKSTHRISEISKRHHAAVDMMIKNTPICKIGEGAWTVQSASREDIVYTVTQANSACECKVTCGFCGVCLHKFVCSCVDSAVHSTACKHSHLVQLHVGQEAQVPHKSSEAKGVHDLGHLSKAVGDSLPISSLQPIHTLRLELRGLLDRVEAISSKTESVDTLKAGIGHLRAAVSTMEAVGNTATLQPIEPKKKVAPNTSNVLQPHFSSTRKRSRRQAQSALTKPNETEIGSCKQRILNSEVLVCALCFAEDDAVQSNKTVPWLQCSVCDSWVHFACHLMCLAHHHPVTQTIFVSVAAVIHDQTVHFSLIFVFITFLQS